jgi:hypothetical protein
VGFGVEGESVRGAGVVEDRVVDARVVVSCVEGAGVSVF